MTVFIMGLVACGGGTTQQPATADDGRARRDTSVTHEPCDVRAAGAERLDADLDGRPEITIVRQGDRELCRAVDLNFDGVVDVWVYRDERGQVRRRETDYDRDGHVDEIAVYRGGVVTEKHRAANLSRKLDTWQFYANGRLTRTERDSDGDAVVDQWWEYANPSCPLIHSDVDGDGRPDPGATVDYCKQTGYVPPERYGPPQAQSPKFERLDQLPTEVSDESGGEGGKRPENAEGEAE